MLLRTLLATNAFTRLATNSTPRRNLIIQSRSNMSWTCSGSTNEELIQKMRAAELIKSDIVAEAMKRVDRANYVGSARPGHSSNNAKQYAYQDAPQSIGFGATISAPHMHAYACEYLLPWVHPDAHILDVGSGSGYTVAIFHHLIKASSPVNDNAELLNPPQIGPGVVVGIDHIPELVEWSKNNLKSDNLEESLSNGEIIMLSGDGRKGWPDAAPYDIIHVGAAAPTIPEELVEMLKAPGRMFIPVGPDGGSQFVWTVDKDSDGRVLKKKLFGVGYVPLTDKASQLAASRQYL